MSSLNPDGSVTIKVNGYDCLIYAPIRKGGEVGTAVSIGGYTFDTEAVAKLHEFMQYHQKSLAAAAL